MDGRVYTVPYFESLIWFEFSLMKIHQTSNLETFVTNLLGNLEIFQRVLVFFFGLLLRISQLFVLCHCEQEVIKCLVTFFT